LVFFAMAPLLRRDPLARFWAGGMLLASIPVCATLPMDRLLTFAGIGASGLLAQYWSFVFAGAVDVPSNAIWRVTVLTLAWLFVAFHAIFAPLALPFRAGNPLGPAWVEQRLYVWRPLGPSLEQKTLVIVNAPSPAHASYLILCRAVSGQSVPRHTRVLAPAIPSVSIRRLDERTLAIRPRGGYLRWPLDRVFRSEHRPLAPGEQVGLTGMTVTITAVTADGRPAEATFRFDVPLESPDLVWLCFRGDGFKPFTLPGVGHETFIRLDWWSLLSPTRRIGPISEPDLDDASPAKG
jgi:hypothetical protein